MSSRDAKWSRQNRNISEDTPDDEKKKKSRVLDARRTQPSRRNASELLKRSDHATRLRSHRQRGTSMRAQPRARCSRPYSALFNHCVSFFLRQRRPSSTGAFRANKRVATTCLYPTIAHYNRKCNGNVRDIIVRLRVVLQPNVVRRTMCVSHYLNVQNPYREK